MSTLSIADSLKYAQLQMAAEAFLVTGPTNTLKPDLVAALTEGNKHSSKFPTQQAAVDFLDHWKVVAQQPNTSTGFSGTLFECVQDDPATGAKKGELVLSMRSTEFIDDAVRDSESTNKEIKDFGWGFGQIADMEKWYAELSKEGGTLYQKQIAVTGYSLGGHLATAFELMHPGVSSTTVTFNGAGVGKIGSAGSLSDQSTLLAGMVSYFDELRSNKDDKARNLMQTASGKELYDQIKAGLESLRTANQLTGMKVAQLWDQTNIDPNTVSAAEKTDADRLKTALTRILNLVQESERIAVYHPKPGDATTPNPVASSEIAGESLDYQLAVIATHNTYNSSALSVVSGGVNTFFGKTPAGNLVNMYELVGTEMDGAIEASMVANSQYHYGQNQQVFIEDQPGIRGDAFGKVITQSVAYASAKLLIDNYGLNDFGDTHSLALMVDSLSLQNVLQQLDPNAKQGTLNNLLKQASNLQASINSTQGKAEGDVLENVVNALSTLFLAPGTYTKLKGSPEGNTWFETDKSNLGGEYTSRKEFHAALEQLATAFSGDDFKDLQGKLTFSTAAADGTANEPEFNDYPWSIAA